MTAAAFAVASLLTGAASLFAAAAWLRSAAYASLIICLLAVWLSALGHPRPLLIGVPQGTVLAYTLDEPHAIYLWLEAPGASEPIAIALPWSEQQASQLQQASQAAKQQGEPLQVGRKRASGGGNAPGQMKFYSHEHQPLPPKVTP